MAQNRKKRPQRTAKPDGLQAMHDAQATAASFGSEGIQTAAGLADNISYATSECMGICATGMEAWLQSCAMSVRTIHEIADEVLNFKKLAAAAQIQID